MSKVRMRIPLGLDEELTIGSKDTVEEVRVVPCIEEMGNGSSVVTVGFVVTLLADVEDADINPPVSKIPSLDE